MTILDFSKFKRPIDKQFAMLTKHDMFRTGAGKDEMWDTYLASFPQGSNPVFRKRTEHDCSCCRQFIRSVGNAVAIIDGKVVSLWDTVIDEPAYQAVADAMAEFVKSHPIVDVFLHPEKDAGVDANRQLTEAGAVLTWNHFHARIPHGSNRGRNYYCPGKDIATTLSEKRAHHDVLLRGLTELTRDSVEEVLDLVNRNSLYRGREHETALAGFLALKQEFDRLPLEERDIFAWSMVGKVPGNVAKLRNTAIGTLLIDLSAGTDLEDAVRKFETSIMAPSNYKRPTALVSQRMVDDARKKVEELGLTSALERRHARLSDVSVTNVIFADRSARKVMRGGAFDGIANKGGVPRNLGNVNVVNIQDFITSVVPRVDSIEVMLEGAHAGNFVSLIAPADPSARPLFKWDNSFSWAYAGDVADSIKERVKKADGNVTGDLCCRLAWSNYDDLDLHMMEPGGFEIAYFAKKSRITDGELDVDMNARGGTTREPVENIFYADRRKMREGAYELFVHQFCKREAIDVGFEVQMDWLGEVRQFGYEKAIPDKQRIVVAKFTYSHARGIEITESLPGHAPQRMIWGLKTKEFHRVTTLMLSPNHWDGAGGVGNRHWFFMLDGCVADAPPRGFFNEFLRGDLDPHRKVLEIVGSRTKVKDSPNQLNGLGFSDTKRAEILVRTKGDIARLLKVAI